MAIDLTRPIAEILLGLEARVTIAENSHPQSPSGRVIVLGDSQQTMPPNTGDVAAAQIMGLGNEVEVVNLSIAGKTLKKFADDMEAATAQLPGDPRRDKDSAPANFNSLFDSSINVTVFVPCGTNDFAVHGSTDADTLADAGRIVSAAHARGARVVFGTVPTRGDASWTPVYEQYRLAHNQGLRDEVIDHDGIADLARASPIQDGADTNDLNIFADELHYKSAVQVAIAPVMTAAVRPTLTGAPYPSTIVTPSPAKDPVAGMQLLDTVFTGTAVSAGRVGTPPSVLPIGAALPWSLEVLADYGSPGSYSFVAGAQGDFWLGANGGNFSFLVNDGSGINGGNVYEQPPSVAGKEAVFGVQFEEDCAWALQNGVPIARLDGPPAITTQLVFGDWAAGGGFPFVGEFSNVKIYAGRRWTGPSSRLAHYPLAINGNGTT